MPDEDRFDKSWRCECGDGHFVSVSYWRGDPQRGLEMWGLLKIEGAFGARLKTRLKHMWQLAAGRGHLDTWAGVVLEADSAREISGVLAAYAVEWDAWQAALRGKAGDK